MIFEAQIAGGLALYDVSAQLPRHATKKPGRRSLAAIQRIYVHHSGRLGRPGLEGAIVSARYAVRELDWATIGYHVWCPWAPVYDDDRRLVVFRCAPSGWITSHTKGCNVHGLGVCLQGNTSTDGLSASQIEILQGLLPWLRETHASSLDRSTWLSWHAESGRFGGKNPKPSCPGKEAEAWLTAYRAGLGDA